MRKHIALTAVTLGALIAAPFAGAYAAQTRSVAPYGDTALRTGVVEASGAKVDTGAQKFVTNMADKAISFLGNSSASQDQKEAEFRRLLKNSFDMKTIGRFALGRYWGTATAQQQQEYLQLFENMVVDVYAARFNEYKGQKLEVAGARADNNDTLVTSYIVAPTGGDKFQVDWRVRNKGGTYKIVDVIIEGVSMSLTQRSDFSSVIQQGGGDVQSLLVHLRGK